jgi:hypothetical protein
VSRAEIQWTRGGIQAEVPVESAGYAQGARRRFAATLAFVRDLPAPVLDLGPPNALARAVEARFAAGIEHTGAHDLDREPLRGFRPGPWGAITAFEILEHVLNPLFVLDGCRDVLRPDGVLYVTVPRRHPHEWLFGKSPEHFHEFAPDELRWVIDKAGFAIARLEIANTSEMAFGVRPLLRRTFHNLMLAECRPRPAAGR